TRLIRLRWSDPHAIRRPSRCRAHLPGRRCLRHVRAGRVRSRHRHRLREVRAGERPGRGAARGPLGSRDRRGADVPCTPGQAGRGIDIAYEKYELENGLDVVLHVDRSDPVVAVALTFHVGSAREVEGRTGFAHHFEHLFFLDSENLGPGGLDRLMTRVGSGTNGSTSRDRTNYFEVVPRDALEKVLWAEADKLGFFINTVTEAVV